MVRVPDVDAHLPGPGPQGPASFRSPRRSRTVNGNTPPWTPVAMPGRSRIGRRCRSRDVGRRASRVRAGARHERSHRSSRQPPNAQRRHENRHRPASTARRAEGGIRRAELVRRLVPEPRAQRRDHHHGQQAETPAQWAAFVRRYKAEMNEPAARHDLALLASALALGKLLGRVLLRARRSLSSVGAEAAAGRSWRGPRLTTRPGTMDAFLRSTDIIDWADPEVTARAAELAAGLTDPVAIVQRCYEWVRDEIKHTGDHGLSVVTCRASEVLRQGSGYCYAKSHLLAALLRANGVPAGLCYQRLSLDEDGLRHCLHGLNACTAPGTSAGCASMRAATSPASKPPSRLPRSASRSRLACPARPICPRCSPTRSRRSSKPSASTGRGGGGQPPARCAALALSPSTPAAHARLAPRAT